MKIVLLNTWRVIESKGGTEKVFCNMANALVSRGHKVLALAYENKEGVPFYPLDNNVLFVNVGGLTKFQKVIREIKSVFQTNALQKRKVRLSCNCSVIGTKAKDNYHKSSPILH